MMEGKISTETFVAVTSTNVAKLVGNLYSDTGLFENRIGGSQVLPYI